MLASDQRFPLPLSTAINLGWLGRIEPDQT